MFLFSLLKKKTLSRADETLNRHKFPSTKFTKEEKWLLLLLMVPPVPFGQPITRYTPRPPHYRPQTTAKKKKNTPA
jgi:hypothetical protein